jgi:cytochrome c2
MFKKDPLLLFIGGVLLFTLTGVLIYKQTHPAWKTYQQEFLKLASQTIGPERTKTIDTGIRQIWIPALHRVDRCTTCHMGYDIPGMEKAPEPFTTHPDLPFMKYHKFSKFGCTICHGGQGYATTLKAAHGDVVHWNEPLLDRTLGEKYGLRHPGHIMEINCNVCHRENHNMEWLTYINQAEDLVHDKSCRTCHIINGKGGRIGPDLTYEGDKNPELYVFANIKNGPETSFNWLYQHFKDPAGVTKGSVMPDFGFTNEQARALTLLVMSWKHVSLPYAYIPKTGAGTETQTAEPAGPEQEKTVKAGAAGHKVAAVKHAPGAQAPAGNAEEGKELFQTKGCTACHTIGHGKLVGPDLKGVTTIRTRKWLTAWLSHTQQMQASDPIAKKLLKQYVVPMPQQSLTGPQIQSLIDYFASTGQ